MWIYISSFLFIVAGSALTIIKQLRKKSDYDGDLEVTKIGLVPILGHAFSLMNPIKSINFLLESYKQAKTGNFIAYVPGAFFDFGHITITM